jgi:hypothetical protein
VSCGFLLNDPATAAAPLPSNSQTLPGYLRRLIWLSLLPPLLLAALMAVDSVRRLRANEDAAAAQQVRQVAQQIDAYRCSAPSWAPT